MRVDTSSNFFNWLKPILNSQGKIKVLSFHDQSLQSNLIKIAKIVIAVGILALLYFSYQFARRPLQSPQDKQDATITLQSAQDKQDATIITWNKIFREIVQKNEGVSIALKLHRQIISQEIKFACQKGFFINNQRMSLDETLTQKMIQGTKSYLLTESEDAPNCDQMTPFEVVDEDTVNLIRSYQNSGLNPVGLNLGSPTKPGDDWEGGSGTQEESLFRRSNYYQAFPENKINLFYPIFSNDRVIYTPCIQFFRTSEPDYTKPLKDTDKAYDYHEPYSVSFIVAAHENFSNKDKNDLEQLKKLNTDLFLNSNNIAMRGDLRKRIESLCNGFIGKNYESVAKNKMRTILRAALREKHDSLVLGALGCGAYSNPPYLNAIYWAEVFNEKEFQMKFKKVGFAIRSFGSLLVLSMFKKALLTDPNSPGQLAAIQALNKE